MSMARLFARALLAFIVLPGLVAGVGPWLLHPPGTPFQAIGLLPIGIGAAGLLWCVREFFVTGRGTLAPWDPPRQLVREGLYRYSRNPMYISVSLLLIGWALGYRSRTLTIYAIVVMVAFHLRVVMFEEPWLARTFGAQWEAYKARVPRWFW